MKSDPDKLLNQLVIGALTVFAIVILLFGAFVLRHLWLQQRIANLSDEVAANLENLEEVTKDIELELAAIEGADTAPSSENLEEIIESLDDVDQQLDSVEQNLDEVVLALEADPGSAAAQTYGESADSDGQRRALQDQVDQVFTVFAILISVAAIVIALLLSMAVRVQQTIP